MNTLAHWISPETMQVLSWTLVHFLWQGAALAALLWFALTAIRSASGRYVASVIVLVLMLAAPVFTFLSLASQTSDRDNAPNIRLVHSISIIRDDRSSRGESRDKVQRRNEHHPMAG